MYCSLQRRSTIHQQRLAAKNGVFNFASIRTVEAANSGRVSARAQIFNVMAVRAELEELEQIEVRTSNDVWQGHVQNTMDLLVFAFAQIRHPQGHPMTCLHVR
jgi:hypothetical protein